MPEGQELKRQSPERFARANQIIYVGPKCRYQSIQDGIDACGTPAGAMVVEIMGGTYVENVIVGSANIHLLATHRPVTIQGNLTRHASALVLGDVTVTGTDTVASRPPTLVDGKLVQARNPDDLGVLVGGKQVGITTAISKMIVNRTGGTGTVEPMAADYRGLVKRFGKTYGGGSWGNGLDMLGGGHPWDMPTPPPRYTDKPLTLCLIADDSPGTAWSTGSGSIYTTLGNKTPYAYMEAAGGPAMSWGIIVNEAIDNPSRMTNLCSHVKLVGGSFIYHSRRHGSGTPVKLANSMDEALYEIPEAVDAFEALSWSSGYYWPLRRGAAHWGGDTFGCWLEHFFSSLTATLGGALMRRQFCAYRTDGGTRGYSHIPAVPRYGYSSHQWLDKPGAGTAAEQADALEALLRAAMESAGAFLMISMHPVVTDDSAVESGLRVSVFKRLVDVVQANRDKIDVVPWPRPVHLHYIGARPNRIINGHFTYPAAGNDLALPGFVGSGSGWLYWYRPYYISADTGDSVQTYNDAAKSRAHTANLKVVGSGYARLRYACIRVERGEEFEFEFDYRKLSGSPSLVVTLVWGGGVPETEPSWTSPYASFTLTPGDEYVRFRRNVFCQRDAQWLHIRFSNETADSEVLLDDVFVG